MKNLITILTLTVLTSCNHQVDNKEVISSENKIDEKIETSSKKTDIKIDSTISIRFLNGYVDLNNRTLKIVDRVNWIDSNRLVSKGFRKSFEEIINKVSDDNPLQADPIFNAQDYPDKGFELANFNNKTGEAILEGTDWPDYKISVQLILLNGETLVDGCGTVNMNNDTK